ncbi:DoxX family membrane protein [Candidatus Nanohaloarchaea archaeon]|nr:DoxX family membrane protein [Candidatus Nanohaloarchaea archaeon]
MVMHSTPLILALRVLIGGYLILSGILKLPDLKGFAGIASSYAIVPDRFEEVSRYMAYLLPIVEVISGAMLLVWILPEIALIFISLSLIIFIAAQLYEMKENPDRPNCGCMGTAVELKLSWEHILLDLGMLLAVLYMLLQVVI